MHPIQLTDEIIEEIDKSDGTNEEVRAIIRKHIERIFRMAEATIGNELSKVRVSDD